MTGSRKLSELHRRSVVLLLALTLCACGGAGEEETLEPGIVAVDNPDPQPMMSELQGVTMSAEQQAALADGVVIEEEYLAGFERFRACMRDGGFDLERVNRRGPIMYYDYSEESRLAGIADECYWREWQELDASWQIGHPEADEVFEALNYCLRREGHQTGTTMEEVERLFAAAGLERQTCFDRWLDDGMGWND